MKSSLIRPSKRRPARGHLRVNKTQEVARAEEAVLVERQLGSLRITPISGSDIGAAIADFEAVIVGHELEFQSGDRDADDPGAVGVFVAEERNRARFGHAESGDRQDPLANGFDRQPFERIPGRRQHRSCRVPKKFESPEKMLAQFAIGFEVRNQQLITSGHVEVNRRRYSAQQLNARTKKRGRRFAGIDVQRAAIVQDDVEVAVAAGGVIPGSPIHHHRRLIGENGRHLPLHLGIGTEHAMRVDDCLRHAGRSRGE